MAWQLRLNLKLKLKLKLKSEGVAVGDPAPRRTARSTSTWARRTSGLATGSGCGSRPRQGGAGWPRKPTLKAPGTSLKLALPGTKRLKLKYDEVLSILLQFWFRFQLGPLHRGARSGPRRAGRRRRPRGARPPAARLPPRRQGRGRGLHSTTFRLNVNIFCGIR